LQRAAVSLSSLLFLLQALAGPLQAQTPPRTVRVSTSGKIGTVRSLTVTAAGPWRLVDLGDRRLVCEGFGRAVWRFELGSRSRVAARGDGGSSDARWTGLEADGFRLESLSPDGPLTVEAGKQSLVYPGAVELTPARRGSNSGLRLLNEAPLESYLTGVVKAEGSASFHPEALKAQAIAARSYAERNRLRHYPAGEVCDTVHCQVYPGVGQIPEKVARAVADTAGVVALFGGAAIDAVFSADCGGRTRNGEDVWPTNSPAQYLRSVEDRPPTGGPDYCSTYRNHSFRLRLSPAQVRGLLGLPSTPAGAVELLGVDRDTSGRVASIQVGVSGAPSDVSAAAGGDADELLPCERIEAGSTPVPLSAGPQQTARTITLTQLRQSFGGQIRGRLAEVTPTPEGGLELESRGLGHGVGLCQWGAQGMALPPYSRTCEEILRHYYTGISLGAAPIRMTRLALQLGSEGGKPLAGVSVRLLPGGPSGITDAQGRWEAGPVPEGTYMVEARRASSVITFHALRVLGGKTPDLRLALVWRERHPRVAQFRAGAPIE
jgi:SpoIID/LytB domain protein